MKILDAKRSQPSKGPYLPLLKKEYNISFDKLISWGRVHKMDHFAQINRVQQVPVLLLNGVMALAGTMAISRYSRLCSRGRLFLEKHRWKLRRSKCGTAGPN
jgi:glutathione S-transferase